MATDNANENASFLNTVLEVKECEKSIAKVEEEKKEEDKPLKDLLKD